MGVKVKVDNESEKKSVPEKSEEGTYSYEEAIELAGNGKYNFGLMGALSMALCSMGLDMFGFSVVVTGCRCEFQLTQAQAGILNSMPFAGPVLTAYLWGYLSDTRGRRRTLLIALSLSFISSALSTLSPNWITLAILKLIATSFSSCSQSATYTLLGESCNQRVRGTYMLVLGSLLHTTGISVYGIGYFVLGADVSYNIGFMEYTPWRIYALVLTMPLFLGFFSLLFHYESPKFLVNAGREDEAIEVLKNIYRRNGFDPDVYPVKKIIIEEKSVKRSDVPLLKSIWDQSAPLFKPPLLKRTLQLFYITIVVYGSGNSITVWFPFIANAFFSTLRNGGSSTDGLCGLLNSHKAKSDMNVNSTHAIITETACSSKLENLTVYTAVTLGFILVTINLCLSMAAAYKKIVTTLILLISSAGALGVALTPEPVSAISFYLLFMSNCLCIGLLSAYYVEFFPTSYRGMAACLSVVVARMSTLCGVNLVGTFIHSHCQMTFFVGCAYVFSGVIMAIFIPGDKSMKKL